MNRPGRAIPQLQQALTIRCDIGDRYGAAWIRHDLAAAHRHLGDVDTAVGHLRHALATRQTIGDQWGEARTLGLLGETLSAAGHRREAEEALRAACTIFSDIGDPRATDMRKMLEALGWTE
jgi:tetratricopeptide (TPR) repeat protein